jgi:rod shape-determining protein MreC
METFLGRYKNLLVLVIVLLAQVIGLAVQVRRPSTAQSGLQDGKQVRLLRYWVVSIVTPPEKVFHSIGSGIRNLWAGYIDLRHTRKQNQELKAEIDRLRFEQAALLEDARQGQRLQSLLAFREHYVYETVPAQIVGTSGTDQARVVYIDKGSEDGLKPDQPVITPDGIVGKVRDVFPHTAQVLEINDQTSGAGVILETTRIRGILRGNAAGQSQIINILPDDRIKPGEKILTSGGDQVFPRGLPVGVVDRIVRDPDRDPYIDILIRPAADLARVEEVLVITRIGDKMSADQMKDLQISQDQQGAAVAAEKEKKKASEVLAERLPSIKDPNAPQTADQQSQEGQVMDTSRPARPLPTVHPDRFSPSSVPPAADLTPGKSAPRTVLSPAPSSNAPVAPPQSTKPASASASKPTSTPNGAERPSIVSPKKSVTPQEPEVQQPRKTTPPERTQPSPYRVPNHGPPQGGNR